MLLRNIGTSSNFWINIDEDSHFYDIADVLIIHVFHEAKHILRVTLKTLFTSKFSIPVYVPKSHNVCAFTCEVLFKKLVHEQYNKMRMRMSIRKLLTLCVSWNDRMSSCTK